MTEDDVASRWIRARLMQDVDLAAAAPGRVWRDEAPSGTVTPYVVYTLVAANDLMVLNGERVWTNMLWQVTGWMTGTDLAVLEPVKARIDARLHRASGTAGDGIVWESHRERPLVLPAVVGDNGQRYRQAGGEYRVRATVMV